jgi:NADH-quinone oxidoreductase subunit N
MSFVILIIAGLLVPVLYKKHITIAKFIAVAAFAGSALSIYLDNSLSSIFIYFASDPSVKLMEYVLLTTLAAVTVSLTGFERPMISQMLFVAGISLGLLEVNNFFMFIVLFEVIAIISYILVANIRNYYNAEGAIKTFIAGAVASGVILLGFALFTGVCAPPSPAVRWRRRRMASPVGPSTPAGRWRSSGPARWAGVPAYG